MTIRSLAVVLALTGCNGDKGDDTSGGGGGDDSGTTDDSGTVNDVDGDGFSPPDDCDDANDAIHPDAVEVCDDVDNDCDGGIDTDATDGAEFWADADADGFGAGTPVTACTAPAGHVDNALDCDDGDKGVNPNALEVCDDLDVDEDCDSVADDLDDSTDAASMTTWYADADLDTFGDPATGLDTCEAVAGRVMSGEDCDDADDLVNPTATEVCGDLVDNNCDGSSSPCGWTGEWDVTDADAIVQGAIDYGYMGNDVAAAGDVNGDGIDDLVVGSSSSGSAYLIHGPVTSMSAADAAAELTTENYGDSNGYENFGLGDQNGDGYDDLVIGAYSYLSYAYQGKAYVVLGPLSGTTTSASIAAATMTGDASGDYLSWQPSAGDVNGDGVMDVLLGAPGSFSLAGGAYIFLGPVTSGDFVASDADVVFEGDAANDWTGGCTGANGDIDGDGTDDVLVSAEQADDGSADDGIAWLFYGPLTGNFSVTDGDVKVHGADAGAHLGWLSAIGGDVDADGLDDLGVSGPSAGAGDVWLFYADKLGGVSDLDIKTADATLTGEVGSDYFGYSMDTAGDLDGDGHDDVAVSAPSHSTGAGAAYVFHGPVSGTIAATSADFTINGSGIEYLGSAINFVGDLDADAFDDLAVGSSSAGGGGGSYRGVVSVWYGGGL